MHLLAWFIATLAPVTLINGLPIQEDTHEQSNIAIRNSTFVSHVRVKRDTPLTTRDIEEADQHGVDLNKMYKHSILKHSNGSDYSIWVHNSFDPDVKDALGRRSWEEKTYAKDRMPHRFVSENDTDTCKDSNFKKTTNHRSPFASGAEALSDWTRKNRGGWRLRVPDAYYSTDLLVGGTNTGANMRFSVRKEPETIIILGTDDVGDTLRGAFAKFKQDIKGVARMAGHGKMGCWNGNKGNNELFWEIDLSDRKIEVKSAKVKSATGKQPTPKPTQQHQKPGYYADNPPETVYYPVPVTLQTIYPPPPHRPPLFTPSTAPPHMPAPTQASNDYVPFTYHQGPEPTAAQQPPSPVYPAPKSPPLVYPAPTREASQSNPSGDYLPAEGPLAIPGSHEAYTSSYRYYPKPGWKPKSAGS